MGKMSLGTTDFAKAAFGSTELKKISLGATELWTSYSGNSGMQKLGTQALSTASVWYPVTGWTLRSGNIEGPINDGLLIPAGTSITWSGEVRYSSGSSSGRQQQARLVVGSTVIQSVQIPSFSAVITLSGTMTTTEESLFKIESMSSRNSDVIIETSFLQILKN
jgi:hypothetical protein